MSNLSQDLYRLITKEAAKPETQIVLLGVRSGDNRIDVSLGAGAVSPDCRFYIASIAKMFTATLIMQLVEAGAIDLDQSAQSLLKHTDLSDLHEVKGEAYGARLTVRQLIHQTSGLADYYEGGLIEDFKRGEDRPFDLGDVLKMTKARPPQSAPDSGKSFYSDSNYQLLGAIVEASTGQPFHDAVRTRICAPLGLDQTEVFRHGSTPLEGLVPLMHRNSVINLPLALSSMGPDGGIVSTTDDLLSFLQGFWGGGLLRPETVIAMQTWNPLFFPLNYGYGVMRFKIPRWMALFRDTPEFVGHSGSTGSFAFYVPRHDVHIVGTFNQLDQARRPYNFLLKVLRIVQQHEATR